MMRPLLALALIALAVACTQTPPPPAPQPAQPVPGAATITPAGGKIEARASSGATLRLEFPPGAVAADTTVSLEPIAASDGALEAFRVKPAGVRLRKPLQLRLTRAGLPDRASFYWRDGARQLPLPSSATAGTLGATTAFLGAAADSASTLGKVRPLETRPEGAELSVRVLDCEFEAFQITQQFGNAARLERFDEAIQLGDRLEAVRAQCTSLIIAQFKQRACADLERATLGTQVTAADSFETFRSLSIALLAARSFVQLTGAECGPNNDVALLVQKFDQFTAFLESQLQTLERASFNAIITKLTEVFGFAAQCELLGLDSVCEAFKTRLYPLVLTKLRLASYNACRGATGPFAVARILTLFALEPSIKEVAPFTTAALEADLMQCSSANNVEVIAFDDVPSDTARAAFASSATATGEPSTVGIELRRNGSLSITGRTAGQTCTRLDAFDEPFGFVSNANLVMRINGREIARRSVGNDGFYKLTPALEIKPARDLPLAGLDPNVAGFTVELLRVGGGCPEQSDAALVYVINVKLSAAPPPPPPPPSIPENAWGGSLTLEYNFTVAWNETAEAFDSFTCGFLSSFAQCTLQQSGSYTGTLRVETSADSTGVVRLGTTTDVLIGRGGSVTGSLNGTFNTATSGSDGACQKSSSGVGTSTATASSASGSPWRLNVSSLGAFQLSMNTLSTAYFGTQSGQGQSSQTAGCSGGARNDSSTTPLTPFNPPLVKLVLGVFKGSVDAAGNVWGGNDTLSFTGTDGSCESFIIDTPAQKGITCSATLKGTWNLNRRP